MIAKYGISRAKWNLYKKTISQNYNETEENSVENMVTMLSKNINKAAETSIPKVTVKANKYPHIPWWNEEIHESIQSRKKYLRKYKRTKQLEDLIQFKKARANARKLI